MVYNRIPVTFNQLRQITAPYINYQYDVVQILVIKGLQLPDYYTVDFCNVGDTEAIPITGTPDGVRIPDELLLTGKDIKAYIILTGIDEGAVETRYEVTLPVRNRPMRSGVTPTPEERLEIETLVNALNDGVERAEDAATEAESQADRAETAADNAQSAVDHYPKIEDSYWYVWLNGGWFNTGVKAEGVDGKGIASVTGQKTSTSGLVDTYILTVTYTDSTTDTITFSVTNGRDGTDGTDGVSPGVTIIDITGGHRVTITDKDHPTGQSFDVMDGEVSQADLDAALATKAPIIIDTASGSIASFSDGADAMPIKALTVSIEPVQSGTGDPSPTNIRPISGWTGCEVTKTGKNLLKITAETTAKNGVTFTVNKDSDGNVISVTANGTATATTLFLLDEYNPVKGLLSGESYTLTSGVNDDVFGQYCVQLADVVSPQPVLSQTDGGVAHPVPVSGKQYFARIAVWSGVTINKTFYPQLELGSTASPYKPYVGETIPVSWQTEAGTVYGGSDEIVSGALVSNMGYVDLGTLTWSASSLGADGNRFFSSDLSSLIKTPESLSVIPNLVCSMYKAKLVSQYNRAVDGITVYTNNTLQLYDSTKKDLTAEQFKTAMSGVQLVYELATPVEYQLDPVTVSTLYGQNNIFADTGNTTVDYCADTKLYLEKLTAPTEDDMIANANIAANKFFMIGNTLYLSTAAIAQGATIVPGTNCNKVSLADALNTLNA